MDIDVRIIVFEAVAIALFWLLVWLYYRLQEYRGEEEDYYDCPIPPI